MRKILVLVLLCGFLFASTGFAEMRYLTEEYPPFNMMQEGVGVQGLAVDLIGGILMNLGESKPEISLGAWKDGYKALQEGPDVCLFSMARIPERDALFKWVGPIATVKHVVITKKGSGVKVTSPEDLKGLTIGTIEDDASHQLARSAGATRFIHGKDSREHMDMLLNGEIDVWAYYDATALWQMRSMNYDPEDFEFQLSMEESDLYYAFSTDVSDERIAELQRSLDELREQGIYDLFVTAYLR